MVDDKKFKEILAYCIKMDEAKKHKASQLQNNIISGNDDARDNIFMPIGSDVSKPNQLEQDNNLSNDDTKSLSLNEKLDANQSIVFTSSTPDCSQSEEVLQQLFLYLLRLIVANQLKISYSQTLTLIVSYHIILQIQILNVSYCLTSN